MPTSDNNRQEAYIDLYTSLGVASMGLLNEVPSDSRLIETSIPALRDKMDAFLEEHSVGAKSSVVIACILLLESLHRKQDALGIELPHPNTLFGIILEKATGAADSTELPPKTSIN